MWHGVFFRLGPHHQRQARRFITEEVAKFKCWQAAWQSFGKKHAEDLVKKNSDLTNMIYITWNNHPKIEIVDNV